MKYKDINEGCNCGKSKRPTIPFTKRPTPVIKSKPKPVPSKRGGPGSSKLHENNQYIMKRLYEEKSKYDIRRIIKIAVNNFDKWIDYQDFEYLQNKLQDLEQKRIPQKEQIKIIRDFVYSHIDNFFDIFVKYNQIERIFLDDNKDEIVNNIIKITTGEKPTVNPELRLPDEGDVEEIIKQSELEKSKPKDYSKMSKYDLQREVDKAIDSKDYDTLRKISPFVKEGFLKYHIEDALNEEYLIKPLIEK